MTANEAIERIREHARVHLRKEPHAVHITEALQRACNALEKQIPTKPNISGTRATVCPSCNRFIDRHEQKHGNIDISCCKWCGQALDWSDTE